ncbi:MAG: hypothetical protein CR217_11335 [Beijerinckiaceae bacterium]|nr:MAG: hypothetical protein CR217_11335 [Beijerinckiaceae bacterium]
MSIEAAVMRRYNWRTAVVAMQYNLFPARREGAGFARRSGARATLRHDSRGLSPFEPGSPRFAIHARHETRTAAMPPGFFISPGGGWR